MIVSRSNDCPKCGSSHLNSCFITYDDGFKCFSCGYADRKGQEHYAFRDNDWIENTLKARYLPEHTTNPVEFSLNVLSWLYSYYMYNEDIKLAGIAYCPPQNGRQESLLFPVLRGDGGMEFQRRYFPSKQFYSSSELTQHLFLLEPNESEVLILCEDYISTIRVGRHIPTLCLFGTSLKETQLRYIIKNYKQIALWLDPDEPGKNAAQTIKNKLTEVFRKQLIKFPFSCNFSITIKVIKSKLQPKEYSPNELKNIINTNFY